MRYFRLKNKKIVIFGPKTKTKFGRPLVRGTFLFYIIFVYVVHNVNAFTVFPLINRSRVSNTSRGSDFICSNRSRGLRASTIELIAHHPVALWCIASFVRIA